jgi:hypothetical protein
MKEPKLKYRGKPLYEREDIYKLIPEEFPNLRKTYEEWWDNPESVKAYLPPALLDALQKPRQEPNRVSMTKTEYICMWIQLISAIILGVVASYGLYYYFTQ